MLQAAFKDYLERKTGDLDWVTKFDVEDYVKNPPMIRALYEREMAGILQVQELQERLEAAEEANQVLEVDCATLSVRIQGLRKAGSAAIWLSPLAVLLTAAGSGLISDAFVLGFLLILSGVGILIAEVLILRSGSEDD